ncbi:hypothetical protein AVEN_167471-1 [Araneus ventricosus]|uniref:Uncharacterized protein n=1 Tax=Araneus ventricosus TaxID=182803 RepID=A0A4Y2ICK5_ARAVE|nr:hypothetical protein AVEN_167471-1 [Araneus ventricosus]
MPANATPHTSGRYQVAPRNTLLTLDTSIVTLNPGDMNIIEPMGCLQCAVQEESHHLASYGFADCLQIHGVKKPQDTFRHCSRYHATSSCIFCVLLLA